MKKDTKKTVKKTSKVVKEFKPKFVVDLTKVKEPSDICIAFAMAKQGAGLPISDTEMRAVIDKTVELSMDCMLACSRSVFNEVAKTVEINGDEKLVFDSKGQFKVKKPNIFKRFWNWITRK